MITDPAIQIVFAILYSIFPLITLVIALRSKNIDAWKYIFAIPGPLAIGIMGIVKAEDGEVLLACLAIGYGFPILFWFIRFWNRNQD